jgi:D-tyrosyl-tRNA(Tyr) deacylase
VRAVVQRVRSASVSVFASESTLDAPELAGEIGHGLLVYLGAEVGDAEADVAWTVDKLANLRVFADDAGRMSRSVRDVVGSVLVVSQFTLFADTSRGRRPSFTGAAPPDVAEALYDRVCVALRDVPIPVATGRFRTHMHVSSVVDGPVTIPLDSRKRP